MLALSSAGYIAKKDWDHWSSFKQNAWMDCLVQQKGIVLRDRKSTKKIQYSTFIT